MSDPHSGTSAPPQTVVNARLRMPTAERDVRLLEQRAQALAGSDAGAVEQEQHESYLRFRLGPSEEYGIPYQYLEEIMAVSVIAKVPCTPPFIRGVANRRGEMLVVLDLKNFFATGGDDINAADGRIVVVRAGGLRVGILVDELVGNDQYIAAKMTKSLPSTGVSNMQFVSGIYDGRVTMLDIDTLLGDPAIIVNESVA